MAFVSRQLSALGWLFRRLGVAISGAESDVASAPTITAGSAAPSSTDEPVGSIYIRVSSTVGIYQYRSSAWVLVVGMGSDFGATGLKADVIAESTAASGVTVDGVLLKDNSVTVGSAGQIVTDTIAEKTAASGVTVDGCLIKDGRAAALATASMFLSAEVTGNGAEQDTAHGFGAAPTLAYAVFTELDGNAADIAHGTHDATNCKFTVTTGQKYRVVAFK